MIKAHNKTITSTTAASFKLRFSFILIIFHLSDQFVATTPISYKYKIESCKDFAGLLEDGILLRIYWHSWVLNCQLQISRRSLQSTFNINHTANKTTKHGTITLILPVKPFIMDLTICMDISSNLGPNIDQNKSCNLEIRCQKPPSSRMGNPCTVNSRYSGHPGYGHLVSVIPRVRSNGVRTKFQNFSVYRMPVVNNSVFGLKCLVYSNI